MLSKSKKQHFLHHFPDNEACLRYLLRLKTDKETKCPKCHKQANFHRMKTERAFSCGKCSHHVHPTAQTPMHRSRISLQKWFYLAYVLKSTTKSPTTKQVQQSFGCTYKAAWRMKNTLKDWPHLKDLP